MAVCVEPRTPRRLNPSKRAMNEMQTMHLVYCNLCDTRCSGTAALVQHYRTSPRHPHCLRCGAGFLDRRELEMHEADKHPRVQCCGLSIPTDDLGEHYFDSVNHARCTRCHLGFEDENELQAHDRVRHPRFVCRVCDLEFASDAALRAHVEYPGIHPQCEFCNRPFKQISALIEHYANTHLAEALRDPISADASAAASELDADRTATQTPDLDALTLDDLDLSSLDPSELADVLAELSALAAGTNANSSLTPLALPPALSSPVPPSMVPTPMPPSPSPLLLLRRRLFTPSPAPSATPTPTMSVPPSTAFLSTLPPLPASPPTSPPPFEPTSPPLLPTTSAPIPMPAPTPAFVFHTPPRSAVSSPQPAAYLSPRYRTVATPPVSIASTPPRNIISTPPRSTITSPSPPRYSPSSTPPRSTIPTPPRSAMSTPPRSTALRAPTPAETPSGDLSDSRLLARTPLRGASQSPSLRAQRARNDAEGEDDVVGDYNEEEEMAMPFDGGEETLRFDGGEETLIFDSDGDETSLRFADSDSDDSGAFSFDARHRQHQHQHQHRASIDSTGSAVSGRFVIGDDEPTPTQDRSFDDLARRDDPVSPSPSPPPSLPSSSLLARREGRPRLVIEADSHVIGESNLHVMGARAEDADSGEATTPTTPTPSPRRASRSPPLGVGTASPFASVVSPRASAMSPHASMMSPRMSTVSPRMSTSPPQRTIASPPQRTIVSPPLRTNAASPQLHRQSAHMSPVPRASQSPSPPRVAGPRPSPPPRKNSRGSLSTDITTTISSITNPSSPRSHSTNGNDSRSAFYCRICRRDPCVAPTATACGHLFCHACIDAEVRRTAHCPVCESAVLLWGLLKLDVENDGEVGTA